jgi:ParB family transcriptional regulator, chromosome partitioning protein
LEVIFARLFSVYVLNSVITMAFQADSIFWVEVEKIVPNPFQPRREFDEAKLKELSESIRMYGILQPLTVTRKEIQGEDGSFRSEYELIAGERRLRASKLAGLAIVPVIIRDGEQSEQEKLELAIIENLQREDLNAVDRALAFRQLADVFNLSHSQVAVKVGRSREYISNSIRLLALPDYMLSSLRTNDITEGHARTLLMLNDRPEEQDVVFREILLKKLSVREVERIARGIATEKVRKKELIDSNLLDIEKQFTDALGTRVSIVKTEFGGRLTIDYFSVDDLEEMLTRMKKEAARKSVPAVYRDESNDTVVSEEVDEEMETLAKLAAATALEPVEEFSFAVAEEESVPVTEVVSDDVVTPEVVFEPDSEPEPVVVEMESIREVDAPSFPASTIEEVIVVAEVTPTPNSTPVAPAMTAPVNPVATTTGKLSLRDQLAALLGTKTEAVDAKSDVAVVAPHPAPTIAAVPPVVAPAAPVVPPTADDSDLYSINRFTV